MEEKFDHATIERKWQERWAREQIYRSAEDTRKEKSYVLDMFPYPSGEGLHVGHPKGYIATDIYSRMKRMQGHAVLHPMGWDAFGLPAENFALKNKIHPKAAVEKNIANFKSQLAKIGFDYDWSREINTTDPAYYKWTQWIFLKLFEHKLAYQSDEPINWCPSCLTGLANEDLDNGRCERCSTPVIKRKMPQWVLRITDYADRLLKDLDLLDWPLHIKESQRNWIGRSEGAEIDFQLHFKNHPEANEWRDENKKPSQVTIFTTRADTIFGAMYLVLAPEHPWLTAAVTQDVLQNKKEVIAYIKVATQKSEIERGATDVKKTGVELKGVTAINPATKEEIPIFAADYVLGNYGTGAIMAVPGHDARDYEFAKKFDLPIKRVVEPSLIQTEGSSAFKTTEPFADHHGVIVILKHWAQEKFLALSWKTAPDWSTLLTGSIENAISPEETVLKEIREETGYLHPRIKESLGTVHGKYFHVPKNANRFGHAPAFYVELEDDVREPIIEEEAQKHVLKWLTLPELKKFLTPLAHRAAVDLYENGFFTEHGILKDSGVFSGRESEEAKKEIIESVNGRMVVRYKIRDWIFSRQRYWGEPIPIIHCKKDGAVAVPYEDLPVKLPEVEHYQPSGTGESPLANIPEWVDVKCPKCGDDAKRETNTMPQWAGSSWYYLRFMDPHDDEQLVSQKNEKYWAPVDVYVGGDHAVRHLIYARFWHKFLYDIAVVSTSEPFTRLEFLGFILAPDGRKMSKRFGNVINPDDIVNEYGADAFRLYEMFMGPFENTIAWSTESIAGTARFVERIWRMRELVCASPCEELEMPLAETIKKVGKDMERFKFNTAVSQLMIFANAAERAKTIGAEQWKSFLKLLAPLAPHLAEELWEIAGEPFSIHQSSWPTLDETRLEKLDVELAVQINGKKRGSLLLAADTSQEKALAEAMQLPAVVSALAGHVPKRVVYVPERILNLVV